jgi:hypothetical protein
LIPPPHGDCPWIESESYVTTDGQPASLSWNKAPIWGLRPDLFYSLTVAGLLFLGALSDERTAFYNCHAALIEITASTGSITVFCESVVSETMYQFPSNGLVSNVYNFQCSYPWKACFVIIWFPGINSSVATRLRISFLETAHVSHYKN